jgi:hypothetical protein
MRGARAASCSSTSPGPIEYVAYFLFLDTDTVRDAFEDVRTRDCRAAL